MFQWICLTIVSPLRKEIEEVNAGLRRIGSEETEIGGQDPCPAHEQIFASQNYSLFEILITFIQNNHIKSTKDILVQILLF